MKKILTIQDFSCYGQCSLTVALPIISTFGIETVCLPTSLLSNHTAGFKGFTCLDLTNELNKIINHWNIEGFSFDGIYTGYLGSNSLVDIACSLVDKYKHDNDIVLCDPAMADFGKLYPAFDNSYVESMKRLVSKSTHIIPNITEAALLTDIEYKDNYSYDELCNMMIKLSNMGPKYVILTGISKKEDELGALIYNSYDKSFNYIANKKINKQFHGTGDIFASVLFGDLINGKTLFESTKLAVDFTLESIINTLDDNDHWYSVHFEKALPMIIKDN